MLHESSLLLLRELPCILRQVPLLPLVPVPVCSLLLNLFVSYVDGIFNVSVIEVSADSSGRFVDQLERVPLVSGVAARDPVPDIISFEGSWWPVRPEFDFRPPERINLVGEGRWEIRSVR